MNEVVITSACRTAIGDFEGSLSSIPATELGAIVIEDAIKRSGITKQDVDEVIMGCVLRHGLGQNPARLAMIHAGLPWEVGAITVNKVCGSGLKAVMLAAQAIACGDAEIVIAGGMENMNLCPYLLPKARTGYRMFNAEVIDGMVHDGLWDHINDFHMGMSAEYVADRWEITRAEMDEFAMSSYQKTWKAQEEGAFDNEIVPVKIPQRKSEPIIFDTDEVALRQPRTSLEKMAKLRPVFKKDGRVTAANASKISDGAAAVTLMSRKKADELGIKPMVRVGAQGSSGLELKYVLAAPILSIPKVLAKEKLKVEDVDIHEINEAFASSSCAVNKELKIDPKKVNLRGGAVAMGHPIGASGARVLVALTYLLKDTGKEIGQASLCLGGGESVTLVLHNEP